MDVKKYLSTISATISWFLIFDRFQVQQILEKIIYVIFVNKPYEKVKQLVSN